MRIDTEFQVNAPVEQVWQHLLRIEDVVTCVPGAEILEVISPDEYKGQVTVKVGPLGLSMRGTARIESRDAEAKMLTIAGQGKDQQGRGTADATVAVRLHDAGDGATRVEIQQDLRVTGRIAQFGRGVMKDVSQRLSQDFARRLEAKIAVEAVAGEGGSVVGVGHAAPIAPQPEPAGAVGGLGLLFWAVSRAVGRLLRRLAGRPAVTD